MQQSSDDDFTLDESSVRSASSMTFTEASIFFADFGGLNVHSQAPTKDQLTAAKVRMLRNDQPQHLIDLATSTVRAYWQHR